nr:immunoglobulin heavy chain junction region [Mus musculus]
LRISVREGFITTVVPML